MPYTRKQQKLARAVAHGFKPTGSAKGFDPAFARQVIVESNTLKAKKKAKH